MKRANCKALWMVLILAAPVAAFGQAKLDPGQLPKDTTFYLAWHGTPSGEARRANALMALWDDADFAPVRSAMIEGMTKSSANAPEKKVALTKEEATEYGSLLDNEFVAGFMANPNPLTKMETGARGPQTKPWNGMFLVYDHTGKEATLTKLLLRVRMNEKNPPKISTETIAGVAAIKVEGKEGVTYWADEGKYSLSAGEPKVFEQISKWAQGTTPEVARLSQSAAFHEASDLLQGGLAEFFFRFQSVRDMNVDSSVMGFRLRPLIQSLKLEAVHSIAGRIELQGARTRIQGAILGDAKAGSLFDIWNEGSASPISWQFITANTVSYHEGSLNLLGIYALTKRALQATVGPSSPIDSLEAGAAKRLGMPVPEVIGLLTGEFASLQTSATLDPDNQVYLIGINQKAEVLKVLRAGFGERLAAERAEGDTTFLKISQGGIASGAGTPSWKYFTLGVAPQVIVAGRRLDSVRETLATRKSASSESASAPQSWQQARAQFPKVTTGLSFFDFQKIDWAAAKEKWMAEANKKSTTKGTAENPRTGAFANAMKDLDPRVFSRHLHLGTSAAWKDAHGVHFDGWIE
jgi:hypothetical protein